MNPDRTRLDEACDFGTPLASDVAKVSARPSIITRVVAAFLVGTICGVISWLVARSRPVHVYQDFAFLWFGAKAILAGKNPYQSVVSLSGVPIFFFPLTTPLGLLPFAFLPIVVAGPAFVALTCGALAFVVTASAWWPLLMFLSGSMIIAVIAANFALVLPLGLFVPWLGWIGVFKPNIGIAILAYRPSLKTVAIMLVVTTLSLLVRPTWPRDWLSAAMASPFHYAPWRAAGGVLLFAAFVRWRLPEARLLLAMALLPSSPIAYEALPLFVIPRDRREMMVLVITTNIIFLMTAPYSLQGDRTRYLAIAQPAMVWLAYAPALLMVLRRPNRGPAPRWVERIAAVLPAWFRGYPVEQDSLVELPRV